MKTSILVSKYAKSAAYLFSICPSEPDLHRNSLITFEVIFSMKCMSGRRVLYSAMKRKA